MDDLQSATGTEVPGGRGKKAAVGAEVQAHDRGIEPPSELAAAARHQILEPHDATPITRGQESSVGREGQACDLTLVTT